MHDKRPAYPEIEQFAKRMGIAPATVTSRAVSSSRLYRRLIEGGSCSLRTAERLRQYMQSGGVNRPKAAAPCPPP